MRTRGKARWIVDVSIGLAIAATLWRAASVWGGDREVVDLAPLADVGERIPVDDLWTESSYQRTAVLVLDTECEACIASLPFYAELGEIASGTNGVRFVILTEEPVERTQQWLIQRGVGRATVVRIASRKVMGILGTPTLMLTDSKGVVTDIALGALGRPRADQFKARLRGDAGVAPLKLPYSIEERFANGRSDQEIGIGAQLVDPRDSVAFAKQHSRSAINIPDRDMGTRARAELDPSQPVFLDCRYEEQARCRIFASTLGDVGFSTIIVVLP